MLLCLILFRRSLVWLGVLLFRVRRIWFVRWFVCVFW